MSTRTPFRRLDVSTVVGQCPQKYIFWPRADNFGTFSDLHSSIVKSTVVEDDMPPIRSGLYGVEFLPVAIAATSLSLHQIKQIKDKLGVTINVVVTTIIFLGTPLYMEEIEKGSGSANTTSATALNTRILRAYKSVEEMVLKPDAKLPWGNQAALLIFPVPKLSRDAEAAHRDLLQFVRQGQKVIQGKRSSFGVYLSAWFMQLLHKFRASRYLYGSFKNISFVMTNVIGPMEKVTAANLPIGNLYSVVPGVPQSLMIGMVSYVGKLTIAVQVEKGFIDPPKLRSHIENAFARHRKLQLVELLPHQPSDQEGSSRFVWVIHAYACLLTPACVVLCLSLRISV